MPELPRDFGSYVLLEQLGRGGMGAIYLAREREGSTPLVIKQLHVQLAADPIFVRRFQHEAQLANVVDSPNLVKVFDIGRIGDIFYIAMEYIAGWSLQTIISSLRKNEHPPPIHVVADLISDVLNGLSALHNAQDDAGAPLGIIHRDIAPKNIMVGENGRARLIDLGIGRSSIADFATRTGIVLGSPGYMSPEQVLGHTIDQRTDVYSTGTVLFELSTLERYVKHGRVQEMLRETARPNFRLPSVVRPDLPAGIDEVVQRALAIEPGERFATAELFRQALFPFAKGSREEHLATLISPALKQELEEAKTHAAITVRDPEERSKPNVRRIPKDVLALAAFAAVAGAIAVSSIVADGREIRPTPAVETDPEPAKQPRVVPAKGRNWGELPRDETKRSPRPKKAAVAKIEAPKEAPETKPAPEPELEPLPPPPPAKSRDAVIAELNALAERAIRLRKNYPAHSKEHANIEKIIVEVTQMSTLPAPETEAKKLNIIERALKDLEPN